MAKPPNILLIMFDDVGPNDVSYQGNGAFTTPAIDALAANALKYSHAYSAASWCAPTRYALQTGRWPCRITNFGAITSNYAPSRVTLQRFLGQQGYACHGVGKWQQGLVWEPAPLPYDGRITYGPLQTGWDSWVGVNDPNGPPYAIIVDDQIERERADVLFEVESPYFLPGYGWPGWDISKVHQTVNTAALAAVKFWARQKGPWFLYLPLTIPHIPLRPAPRFVGSSGLGPAMDLMKEADVFIGAVTAELRRAGALADTLVIITADNAGQNVYDDNSAIGSLKAVTGYNQNAPHRGMKADIYEGGLRVFFLLHWPAGIPAGTVSRPICHSDVFATLAQLAGRPLTRADQDHDVAPDSLSLCTDWGLPATGTRPAIIIESFQRHYAIREQATGYKAIRSSGGGGYNPDGPYAMLDTEPLAEGDGVGDGVTWRLFDVIADPGETTNLAASQPAKLAALQALFAQFKEGQSYSVTR